jgi:hypothetical protein
LLSSIISFHFRIWRKIYLLFFFPFPAAFFAGELEVDFDDLGFAPRLAGDLVSLLRPRAGDFRLGEDRELEVVRFTGDDDFRVFDVLLVGEADFDLDFEPLVAFLVVVVFAFFLEGEVLDLPREGDFDFLAVGVFFRSLVPTVPALWEFFVVLFGDFRFTEEELVERFTGDFERSPNICRR